MAAHDFDIGNMDVATPTQAASRMPSRKHTLEELRELKRLVSPCSPLQFNYAPVLSSRHQVRPSREGQCHSRTICCEVLSKGYATLLSVEALRKLGWRAKVRHLLHTGTPPEPSARRHILTHRSIENRSSVPLRPLTSSMSARCKRRMSPSVPWAGQIDESICDASRSTSSR